MGKLHPWGACRRRGGYPAQSWSRRAPPPGQPDPRGQPPEGTSWGTWPVHVAGRVPNQALSLRARVPLSVHGSDFLWAPWLEPAAEPGCGHVPARSAVTILPPEALSTSTQHSRLRATTIFLPNFPAELTEGCEGQGACPGSPSETAKPLASGQGCGTLVPAPHRVTNGPSINNRNNRIPCLFGGRMPPTATGVVVCMQRQALAGWKAHEPEADGPPARWLL